MDEYQLSRELIAYYEKFLGKPMPLPLAKYFPDGYTQEKYLARCEQWRKEVVDKYKKMKAEVDEYERRTVEFLDKRDEWIASGLSLTRFHEDVIL